MKFISYELLFYFATQLYTITGFIADLFIASKLFT